MSDYMEYLEQFNSVLADAICTIDGIPDFLGFLQVEALYDDVDFRVAASCVAHELGFPAEKAAIIFAVYEEMRVDKGKGLLSKLLSGKTREKISKLQKIRTLLFPVYKNFPPDEVKIYLLALSRLSG